MCPICLATATLATLGATSVGGLTAIASKKRRRRKAQKEATGPPPKEYHSKIYTEPT